MTPAPLRHPPVPIAVERVASGDDGAEFPSPPLEIRGAAIRGMAWSTLEKWGTQLLALGAFIVLGRLLAPKAFGLVAAANVIIAALRVLVDQGFSQALVQRRRITVLHVDTAFWTALGTGIAFSAITFAAAPLVALLFSQPGLTGIVRALSPVFILASLDATQSALVNREMRFRVQAVRRLAAAISSAGVGIALAVLGAGAWALVAQILTLEAVGVVLLWPMVSWRPRRRFSHAAFRDLFGFGGRFSVIRVLTFLNQNADNFLVGVWLGAVALGYYTVGYRVLLAMNTVIAMTLSQVALPAFSKLQADSGRLREAMYRAVSLSAAVSLPLYVGLALTADRLIPLVFGDQWHASIPVMQALTAGGIVLGGTTLTRNLVLSVGRVRNELRWTSAITAVRVAGFAATAPFGILPVAVGFSAVSVAAWPVRLWLVSRWTPITTAGYFRQYLGPVAATLLMAAGIVVVGTVALPRAGAVPLLAELGCGALLYPLGLRLFAPMTTKELLSAARDLRPGR